MKKIFLIILLLNLFNGLFAQKVSNPLKKYEISFLDLIIQDSSDFYTTIDNNEFKLGTDFTGATFINIAKHKGELYLHPLGTGRLYQIQKINNQYKTKRVDSTIHSGVNFFSKSFFARLKSLRPIQYRLIHGKSKAQIPPKIPWDTTALLQKWKWQSKATGTIWRQPIAKTKTK